MLSITPATARAYAKLGQAGALFGVGLMHAVEESGKVPFLVTADMAKPAGMTRFRTKFPERFLNVGIAEQNLVGIAAGLASEGHPVIASAQAAFLSMRSFEQVRQYAGYMRLPLILVGISSGFGLTFFGNTHYAVEDLALMRTIPGMTIVSPSDPGQAALAISVALERKTPTYIRCTGQVNAPVVYDVCDAFTIGPGRVLRDGTDVLLLATGAVTAHAVSASDALRAAGISVAVVDVSTIKPFHRQTLDAFPGVRLIVTVEEHSVIGGLGGAVAEVLADSVAHPPLLRIGVPDTFSVPGDYPYLIRQAGLDEGSITARITDAMAVR
jgi:transketolase